MTKVNQIETEDLRRRIGKNLRIAREEAGYRTAQEFSDKHGYAQSTYIQHENGNRSQIKHLDSYARDLGVSVAWLMSEEGADGRCHKEGAHPSPKPEEHGTIICGDESLPFHKDLLRHILAQNFDRLRASKAPAEALADLVVWTYEKHRPNAEEVLRIAAEIRERKAQEADPLSMDDTVEVVDNLVEIYERKSSA